MEFLYDIGAGSGCFFVEGRPAGATERKGVPPSSGLQNSSGEVEGQRKSSMMFVASSGHGVILSFEH